MEKQQTFTDMESMNMADVAALDIREAISTGWRKAANCRAGAEERNTASISSGANWRR
jgi:hypothetical protein